MCFLLYLGIYLFLGMLTLAFFSYFDKERRLNDVRIAFLVLLLWPVFWIAVLAICTQESIVWLRDRK